MASLMMLALAFLGATFGPRLMRLGRWSAAPRWGIRAWQALSIAVASSLVLAGLAAAIPVLVTNSSVLDDLPLSPAALCEHYGLPGGTVLTVVVLTGTALLIARIGWFWLAQSRATRATRQGQLSRLDLIGSPEPAGYYLLTSTRPLVYCLPGRRSAIVVTTAARELLSARKLDLVLAHERSHLRARHDVALDFAAALRRAFAPISFFAVTQHQIARLAEMQADDDATRSGGRRTLASALLTLSFAVPQPGLGAGAVATAERVRRLSRTPSPWGTRRRLAAAITSAAVLVSPALLLAAPALEALATQCCGTAASVALGA
ncbi:M56 family metallopeptidase [Nocardioides sp. Bht2]|uniref:M56 family metallopeptidase n=1 Tax=Nocardioides sp. Bht2 TaxID=3392297 RepID=UPI0039B6B343